VFDRNQIEELTPINCIEGSLICQHLIGGTLIGGDYDGRLGPLTLFINNLEIIRGATVLDLGSNAGHFPIEYIRAGAKSVTAVEGRSEFKSQFLDIKDRIAWIDANKIDWIDSDLRDYTPDKKHDIISAFGVAYHVERFWPILMHLAFSQDVKHIIFESAVDDKTQCVIEIPQDRTKALYSSVILMMTVETMEHVLSRCFSEYDVKRIWLIFQYDHKESDFPGHKRGLWILTKKEIS